MRQNYLLFLVLSGFLTMTSCVKENITDYGETDDENEEFVADVTITLNNIGSSAWQVVSVTGTEAADVAELNTENPALTLQEGTRYRFVNQGGTAHPLEFRDANGEVLLAQFEASGSFENDAMVNYQEDSQGVTFTLTTALNEVLASYFCSIHASMNGSINQPAAADIVSIASATEELSTLVEALSRFDDLVTALSGEGNFTVFAPTNEAFNAFLSNSAYATLEDVPDDVLRSVLTYHVIGENAIAGSDITQDLTAETLNGQSLSFTLEDENIIINEDVRVTQGDVMASNGIVHIIDGVLVPMPTPDATITIDNVGASAWIFTAIEGEGASATLNEENTVLTLAVGSRYRFINEGGDAHPLAFLDADGGNLLSEEEGQEGDSYESDIEVNFVVNSDGVSFTLTEDLAEDMATYICTVHSAMVGDISTEQIERK